MAEHRQNLRAPMIDDYRKILGADATPAIPATRRPLSVGRLAEIDQRLEWLEWTLTQEPEPRVTSEWRYLLVDARDLLTALAETTTERTPG
ncbi:MAG: hypothetical protein E6J91_45735 [Deltaproteobacteria bacterium]|nr:MAG: hypothetical protein E6J91_45735 [Deltaproteobacteria bacterium]